MNVKTTETLVQVKSEYSEEFIRAARKLGGRWNSINKSWDFNIAKETAVKALDRYVRIENDLSLTMSYYGVRYPIGEIYEFEREWGRNEQ
jgi:hypothetical protein